MQQPTQTEPSQHDPLAFSKMSGAGNDFVVIDNRSGRVTDPEDLARRICTRALSVGADGLILVERSSRASFRMRYYNRDGSLAAFCANGTRCAARFAFLNVIAGRRMTIETDAGIVGAEINDTAVTLSLQAPFGYRPTVPLELEGGVVDGSFITVGVPHYVLPVEGDLWTYDVDRIGAAIRNHPALAPAGANVNFIEVRDRHSIDIRTYERGVENETLACGSGIVASAVVSALSGHVESPVSLLTRSGIVVGVSFTLEDGIIGDVRLTGDGRHVYRATVTPETLSGFDPDFIRHPASRVAVP